MCQVFVTLNTFTSWDFTWFTIFIVIYFQSRANFIFSIKFLLDSDNKVLEIGHKLKYYEYSLYQHLVFMTQ